MDFERPLRSISKVSINEGLIETPATWPISHKSSSGHWLVDGAGLFAFLKELGRSSGLAPVNFITSKSSPNQRNRAARNKAVKSPSAESISSLECEKLIGNEIGNERGVLLQVGHTYAAFTESS